ncbi:MAG: universal stress protein [Chloroflexi bacterium]|nr:universal stress protein [Chloroflexota bacterium]
MHILCAVGIRGGAQIVRRAAGQIDAGAEWLLLHVIDVGPRRALERFGPPHRPPPPPPPPHPARDDPLDRAEESSGEEVLREALAAAQALSLHASARLERGDPNEVLVRVAQQWNADVIVIGARERQGQPSHGPASVGHTARFVLDHAPCDVLLLRAKGAYATGGGERI